MEYYQYTFDNLSKEQGEIIIALLMHQGFDAFEEQENCLLAFTSIPIKEKELESYIGCLIPFTRTIIQKENWNANWERDFHPVTVNMTGTSEPFVHLRAGFHPPEFSARYEIIITPKMSFGTGHHPTTYSMMSAMGAIEMIGKSVIDFGTGTGVLAILAEKMGASRIVAIDNDEWSIINAEENAVLNDCHNISLLLNDHFQSPVSGDIILANINLNVIVDNLETIVNACNKDAILLLSGMLHTDREFLMGKLAEYPVELLDSQTREGWLLIKLQKI